MGTLGNIASDTACVVIPPLAGIIYMGVGKHLVVAMIAGLAGAQAGFSANLMIAGTDSLLRGLTNEAMQGFIPGSTFEVDVTCNWFFMMASTLLCAVVIGFVCEKVAEPRFPKCEGSADEKAEDITPEQKKGLNATGIAALVYIAVLLVGFFAFSRPLARENGAFVGSPILKGLIPILFVLFSICGLAYGYASGSFKNTTDVNKAMSKQMAGMGSYVLFCFFCGQFQALFNWTKLGTMLTIAGADFLENVDFTGIPMCVVFILISAFINIFVSSDSAKWAIFVPMFMLLGYHPAFTQLCYRLGDSPENCFTPMSPYIWMILSVAQTKYGSNLKIGTIVANIIPIAAILQVIWIIFLVIWVIAGILIGSGTGVYLPASVL